MITLRPYQQQAFNDAVIALKKSERKRIILEMPTGGGKTYTFAFFVQGAEKKGSKTLILTDRAELLTGTGSALKELGVHPSYVIAGRKNPPLFKENKTVVSMAQTLKNRVKEPSLPKPDALKKVWDKYYKDLASCEKWRNWLSKINLVIIDEVHKQEFNTFFEAELFEGKTVLGVSATPKRGGKQRQLGIDFDSIVHTLTVTQLIEMGFLMPDMYFGFNDKAPDMKGVAKNIAGDYSESDMFKKYDNPKLYGGVIEAWKEHTPNTISLIFCTNIIHCVRTAKEFCEKGISAKFLVSKMSKPKRPNGDEPDDKKEAPAEWVRYWEKLEYYTEYNDSMLEYSGERDDIIKRWKAGEFKVLINAGILTTGFDFPAIETIVLFRATVSEVLYLQMLGRGSRPCIENGKTHFNILDFGRNAERLGGYKLPRQWHLFHEGSSGNGVPPTKECGSAGVDKNGKLGCGDYVLASAKICPNPECGYIFPTAKEPEAAKLELMYTDQMGKLRSTKPLSVMDYDELDEFKIANKHKDMWLYIHLFKKGGLSELQKYAKFRKKSLGWATMILSKIPQSVKQEIAILNQAAL